MGGIFLDVCIQNEFYFSPGVGDLSLAVVAALHRADHGRRLADLHLGHPAAARGHVVPLRPGSPQGSILDILATKGGSEPGGELQPFYGPSKNMSNLPEKGHVLTLFLDLHVSSQ